MDIKAVKAEEKAAKENEDTARLTKIAAVLKKAQEELNVTKLMVQWKNREVMARKGGVNSQRRRNRKRSMSGYQSANTG